MEIGGDGDGIFPVRRGATAESSSFSCSSLAVGGRLALSEGGGECNSGVAAGGGGISLLSLSLARLMTWSSKAPFRGGDVQLDERANC